VTPDGWEVSKTEYVALTTESGGLYYTYYLIPERDTSKLASFFINWWCGYEFPDFYFRLFIKNTELSSDGKYLSAIEGYNDAIDRGMSIVSGSMADYMLGYVYCTVRSKDNTLVSVSELYYGDYDKCLDYLPTNNITQLYYNSSHDLSVSSTSQSEYESFPPTSVKTKNLNYLVSVSTYSITAYDYFDNTAAANGFMSDQIPRFTYSGLGKNGGGSCNIVVPECIRGPNYPTEYNYLSMNSSEPNYYLQEGFFTSDRAFIMFPSYSSTSSACHMNIFVFPEEVKTPILYAKYCLGDNRKAYTFLQILSKVDYEFYHGTILQGTFDAETTTYTCIQNSSNINTYYDLPMNYELNSNSMSKYGATMQAGTEYKVYPYLRYNMGNSASGISLLNWFGNNTTFSIFPDNSNTLGFYTYVSPNISDEVLNNGNSGEVGGNIFDNIGGGGSLGPDIFFDGEFFTELNNSEVFDLDLPPYPDASGIFNVDFSDIWLIPERIIEYLILVIDWISTSFEIFVDKIGGPIYNRFNFRR